MTNKAVTEIFDKGSPESYDERNKSYAPISNNLHFLIRLVLADIPKDARVLCVGVGTGVEIVELATAHPGWHFVGVDPSSTMLEGCKKRLESCGLTQRCEVFHGYLSDLCKQGSFDVALCLLVTHFIKDLAERQKLFSDIASRLNSGGYLINVEISYDTSAPEFLDILEKWKTMQGLSGAPQDHLDKILDNMKEHLLLLPPSKTEELMRVAGLSMPIQFFQSLLIHGWYAQRK